MNGYANFPYDVESILKGAAEGGGWAPQNGAYYKFSELFDLNKPIYISTSSIRTIALMNRVDTTVEVRLLLGSAADITLSTDSEFPNQINVSIGG